MADATAQLAATIAAATTSSAPTPTMGQGIVTAWNSTATPPTVAVQLSGGTTSTNLQYLPSYSPNVGDIVQTVSQNGSVLVIGAITQQAGWQTTSISGITYMLGSENGAQYVQFKGNGTATSSSLFTLPTGYRPSGTREYILVLASFGLVILTIGTSGACTIAAPPSGGTTSFDSTANDFDHSHNVNAVHSHTHGGAVAESDFLSVESDDSGSIHSHGHTHTLASGSMGFPNTIYIDGTKFYL